MDMHTSAAKQRLAMGARSLVGRRRRMVVQEVCGVFVLWRFPGEVTNSLDPPYDCMEQGFTGLAFDARNGGRAGMIASRTDGRRICQHHLKVDRRKRPATEWRQIIAPGEGGELPASGT